MVEPQSSKLITRVRFPSSPPYVPARPRHLRATDPASSCFPRRAGPPRRRHRERARGCRDIRSPERQPHDQPSLPFLEIPGRLRSVEPDNETGKVHTMTDIQTAPKTGSNADVAAGVAQYLTPVVHELIALAVNGKQAHWHVRGANFIAVHELLDEVVAHAQDWSDLAAERVVALGLPIDGRLATVASKTGAENPKLGFLPYDEAIAGRRRPDRRRDREGQRRDRRSRRARPGEPGRRDRDPPRARQGPLVPLLAHRRQVAMAG